MDQTVTCVECGEEFNTEQELHQHNIEVHNALQTATDNPETETESCPVCGALFKTVQEKEKHVHDTHGME